MLDNMATNFIYLLFVCGTFKVTQNTLSSHNLIFNPTSMTWIEAASWCQLKGGELVRVDSPSVVDMVNWYKANDWSTHWNHHIWTGLYSYNPKKGYWQGSCECLDYSYWADGQTFDITTPCMYMDNNDLRWHYDECESSHYVVCQTKLGNCTFDDKDNAVDQAHTAVQSSTVSDFEDCKSLCDNYFNGNQQCWVIQYHLSSQQCNIYASVNPMNFFSTKENKNKNLIYSARSCFSASVQKESASDVSTRLPDFIEACEPMTTVVDKQSANEEFFTKIDYIKSSPTSTASSLNGRSIESSTIRDTSVASNVEGHYVELSTMRASSDKTHLVSRFQSISTVTSTTSDSLSNAVTSDFITNIHLSTTVTIKSSSVKGYFTEPPTIDTPEKITDISTLRSMYTGKFETSDVSSKLGTRSEQFKDKFTDSSFDQSASTVTLSEKDFSTSSYTLAGKLNTSVKKTQEVCSFQCPCPSGIHNLTKDLLEKRLNELKSSLEIDKTKTNTYIRKRTSAKDDRSSSQAIGTVSALFIACSIGFIIGADIINLFRTINCRYLKTT